jgi:RNA polymerase sigma-70 factor (ECF subfamily)
VRRVARDERRAAAIREIAANDIVEGAASQSERPDEAFFRKSAVATLHAILATMDEDKRDVLVLSDLEGFSAPEIAQTTGANVNTIYARLRAARLELTAALDRLAARGGRHAWNR